MQEFLCDFENDQLLGTSVLKLGNDACLHGVAALGLYTAVTLSLLTVPLSWMGPPPVAQHVGQKQKCH